MLPPKPSRSSLSPRPPRRGARASRWARRLAGDTRGTTIVEYAVILLVVFLVAVVAYKVLASSVSKQLGVAGSAANGETTGAPAGPETAGTGKGSGTGAADNGYSAYDENGKPTHPGGAAAKGSEESSSMLPRFAILCVAVLGAAGVIFAIMKGKHAS
jgi:Flp pilus assembly pilin Flp